MEQLEDIRRKTLEEEALDKASTRQMLRCYGIGAVIWLLLGGLLIGCNRRPATYHRENGWYQVVNTNADGLAREPIVTAKDFETLRLDTDALGKLIIFGQVHPYYVNHWAVETEKAIGRQIA